MDFNEIIWNMSGIDIENESFIRIEKEIDPRDFPVAEWPVIRRLIHTTADFSIADLIKVSLMTLSFISYPYLQSLIMLTP